MNREQRTVIKAAIDAARRAQLDAKGGYEVVERDAKNVDRWMTREAHLREVRAVKTNVARTKRRALKKASDAQKALKAEQRKVRQLESRVEHLEVALRLAQGRRHLRVAS